RELLVRRAAEAPFGRGDRVELGLELVETAGLRLEGGEKGMEIGCGLAQAELDVAQLVARALQLGREPLERRDRALRQRDEIGGSLALVGRESRSRLGSAGGALGARRGPAP